MKIWKIAFVAGLLITASCAKPQKQEKPLLLASIHPYELLLRQLAGSEFEVKSIIPPGASPHTWTPAPADLEDFGNAALIMSNGMGLEANLEKNFSVRKDVHVETATLLKDLLPTETEAHETDHNAGAAPEHHHAEDPHLWTSPLLMSRLVGHLEKELSQRFPNSSYIFSRNAEAMRKELDALSIRISGEKSSFIKPGIITYHNSFGQFCRETGIENLGWVQSSPGKEPTPQELNSLGKLIETHAVKAIFLEPQMNKKAGQILAKEFGLKLLILDPLGSDGKAQTITDLISQNWENMKQGFTPQ